MRHPLKSLAAVALGVALVGTTPALATAATTATGVSASSAAPLRLPMVSPIPTTPATIVPNLLTHLLTVTPAVYSVPGFAQTYQWFVNGLLVPALPGSGGTQLPIPTDPSAIVHVLETFTPNIGTSAVPLPGLPTTSLGTLTPALTQVGDTLRVQGAGTLDTLGGVLGGLFGTTTQFQFLRDGLPVGGPTSDPVYLLTGSDLGHTISVRLLQTVTDLTDPLNPTTTTTPPSNGVPVTTTGTAAPAYSASTPRITGRHQVGKRLHARNVSVSAPGYTVTYTWLRNGRTIAKHGKVVHGLGYKVARKDRGKRITFRITLTYPGYAPKTVSSASVKIRR
jgi:hypothetical protein